MSGIIKDLKNSEIEVVNENLVRVNGQIMPRSDIDMVCKNHNVGYIENNDSKLRVYNTNSSR